MKKVTFGMFYEMYGQITVDVPDEVTEDNIVEYLMAHWDEYPLPSGGDYVSDSAELDTEYIEFEED